MNVKVERREQSDDDDYDLSEKNKNILLNCHSVLLIVVTFMCTMCAITCVKGDAMMAHIREHEKATMRRHSWRNEEPRWRTRSGRIMEIK